MIPQIPIYISIVFGLTVLLTLILFYSAIKNAKIDTTKSKANPILIILILWIIMQSYLALSNFYNIDTKTFPPKLFMGVIPPLFMILILFISKKGSLFMDSLSLKTITWLNIVRIPVEIVLYWLSINMVLPELMTFEGKNFDILVGITAPIVAYFGFSSLIIKRKLLLLWNIISLAMLLNIVTIAVLSAPFTFQQFAFSQPNVAVLNFPFNLLPVFIVPIILFGHLVSLRQLLISSIKKDL